LLIAGKEEELSGLLKKRGKRLRQKFLMEGRLVLATEKRGPWVKVALGKKRG